MITPHHQNELTRLSPSISLEMRTATAHSSGLGTSKGPPAFLAAEKAGFSEVVTTGMAGRILNPRSQDSELKDRCDYSS